MWRNLVGRIGYSTDVSLEMTKEFMLGYIQLCIFLYL